MDLLLQSKTTGSTEMSECKHEQQTELGAEIWSLRLRTEHLEAENKALKAENKHLKKCAELANDISDFNNRSV